MRVARLPYDHCPQLAAMSRSPETRVRPQKRDPYVDQDLYRFEFLQNTEKRLIDGREKTLLRTLDACRELLIPVGPLLRAEFGLDADRLDGRDLRARFQLTVAVAGRPPETLMDVTVESGDGELWRRRAINLERYELQRLTMCLAASVDGANGEGEQAAAWGNPPILSRREQLARVSRQQRITDQERRVREQNLKALGYVE
jgi:hypothetical protein